MIYLIDVVNQIYKGWQQCWYNYGDWKRLIKNKYDPYITWEFFSYMNNEIKDPYVLYLSCDDYDALVAMINSPPKMSESLEKLFERIPPWENNEGKLF